jgi:hypothetical protein
VKHLTSYRERLTNHATSQLVTLRLKITQGLTGVCRKYLPVPILWAGAKPGAPAMQSRRALRKIMHASKIALAKGLIQPSLQHRAAGGNAAERSFQAG